MIAPLTKITITLSALFALAACAPNSDSSSSNQAAAAPAPADSGKLQLKTAGVKRMRVGASADLRPYLLHFENASYKILVGTSVASFESKTPPRVKFKQAGLVGIRVTDAVDGTVVDLKFRVTIDTTGSANDLTEPDFTIPDVPVLP